MVLMLLYRFALLEGRVFPAFVPEFLQYCSQLNGNRLRW